MHENASLIDIKKEIDALKRLIDNGGVFLSSSRVYHYYRALNHLKKNLDEETFYSRNSFTNRPLKIFVEEKNVTISTIVKSLQGFDDDFSHQKSITKIVDFLVDNQYLSIIVIRNRCFKTVTTKGEKIGLFEKNVTDKNGVHPCVFYTPKGQNFIRIHLEEIFMNNIKE